MLNNTFRYLDGIFTNDNPEFENHIPVIYPAHFQLNGVDTFCTSDKETSFLDLDIKVIDSYIHTSVYEKRDDFRFPIVNFPWLSDDDPGLQSHGIYISQLARFAMCCTSVLDFHSKNPQIISKLSKQGYRSNSFEKHLERSLGHTLSFCTNSNILLSDYVSEWLSHPVFDDDRVYKLQRVKGAANFISFGSKIV